MEHPTASEENKAKIAHWVSTLQLEVEEAGPVCMTPLLPTTQKAEMVAVAVGLVLVVLIQEILFIIPVEGGLQDKGMMEVIFLHHQFKVLHL